MDGAVWRLRTNAVRFELNDEQGQCLAMGMGFSEREKNLFAGHLRRDFLSSRA